MKRKVIQIANSTQLVSLPRKWALKYGIKKGDELDIDEQGNKLVIRTQGEPESKKSIIDLSQMETLRLRILCAAYLHGYDEIEVTYNTPDYIQKIQQVLSEFAGYEIIKQGKNNCIIRQISKPTAEELESISNRLFLLLHETGSFILEGSEKKDKEMLDSIKFREASINKFTNFCRRIINKIGHKDLASTTSMYLILTYLEHYGDELKHVGELFSKRMHALEKLPMNILREINDLFIKVYRAYQNKSLKLAVENAIMYDKIDANLEKLRLSKKRIDVDIYYSLTRLRHLAIMVQEAMLPLIV